MQGPNSRLPDTRGTARISGGGSRKVQHFTAWGQPYSPARGSPPRAEKALEEKTLIGWHPPASAVLAHRFEEAERPRYTTFLSEPSTITAWSSVMGISSNL